MKQIVREVGWKTYSLSPRPGSVKFSEPDSELLMSVTVQASAAGAGGVATASRPDLVFLTIVWSCLEERCVVEGRGPAKIDVLAECG